MKEPISVNIEPAQMRKAGFHFAIGALQAAVLCFSVLITLAKILIWLFK